MRPGTGELDLATALDIVVLGVDIEVGDLLDTAAGGVLGDGRDAAA